MSFLNDYFYFSRAERYGIFGLCGLILLALIIKLSIPFWIKPKNYDIETFADEIKQFQIAVNTQTESATTERSQRSLYSQSETELFYFDPNHISDKEWEKLGFNERQIRNIRNYQKSGGNFRKKEDLQKLYTISNTQYVRLEPYIRIASNNLPTDRTVTKESTTPHILPKTSHPSSLTTNLIIELNNADSALLTQLSGIGPVLATRTLRYRNLIGGFVNVQQLNEVYGVNPELVERLSNYLSIDTSLVRKIPINKATLNELTKHPYINEQQARGILAFRKFQTRIDNLDELIKNNIIQPETAQKIKPYISFE